MTKRRLQSLIGVLLTMFVVWFLQKGSLTEPSPSVPAPAVPTIDMPVSSSSSTGGTNALVVQVVDGDTLGVLFDGTTDPVKARLLGINTPESVDPRRPVECFGKEASRFLQGMIDGKRVRLEEDVQADERDKYGRLLRNVFLEDGTDVNALLVREGYAQAYLSYPLNKQRKHELSRLQEEAKMAERGLWSKETCGGMK